MHFITLDRETDFDGWRKAARALVLHNVSPSDVTWTVRDSAPELFEPLATPPLQAPHSTFNVAGKFVELAQSAILHRAPERFAILYRLLWRLRSNHDLLSVATDPDVSPVVAMARATHHDQHRMKASVRSAKSAANRNRITSPGSSRSITSSRPPHHFSPAVSPTCRGRS
jgi:DNA polymerase